MRIAKNVLLGALVTLVLCAVSFGQTLRSESDPRNQSPAVGTGGPEGGPTGLFTIYDGSTIRKGEFTFSIAYSNYDRDPGDADIVDIPASFNIGINDHVEIFFKSTAYRGIKVNSPNNLSGFYLPNIANPSVRAAIILSPLNIGTGPRLGSPLFRPLGNQPFVQYPFFGGPAGTYGLTAPPGAWNFVLGASSGGAGSFGTAAIYPGVGSVYGGVLPGIVLATTTIPPTAGTSALTVPLTYTIAPSYLPDAPFLGRVYGESAFNDFTFGAKIRFTGPDNPLGIALIPFYRWWHDHGKDLQGFNELERGAGPGGSIGDFGLVLAVDGRLGKHVNLSGNAGIIRNSNPKDPSGHVLLDRPDEFITGVGIDFPVNKHFQPIAEFRDTWYVGGRTPNAFENNPIEVILGAKMYPKRWLGFGVAYRRHLNEQSRGSFNSISATNQPVVLVNPATGTFQTVQPAGGPSGFRFSTEPNGFMLQAFAGHRNAREPDVLPNRPPVVSLAASTSQIVLPCPPGEVSTSCPTAADMGVRLTANASDPDGDTLLYTYSTTGGRISGEGPNVNWDLSGAAPGTYTATVEVDDGCGCMSFSSTTVTVVNCPDCKPPCPTINVSCPSEVEQGQSITFSASVNGGPGTQTYNWSVSAGTITSGQGTSTITVDTANEGGQTITATVELGGLDPICTRTGSCTTSVKPLRVPRKFDEYGNIRFNDEKARLDNFAIQLQNEPDAQGYILAWGSCDGEGQARANRARDYLVNTRGIDAGRLVTVDGGCMEQLKVELWIRPQGASDVPVAQATVSPCPVCKKKPARPRRPRTHRHGEEED